MFFFIIVFYFFTCSLDVTWTCLRRHDQKLPKPKKELLTDASKNLSLVELMASSLPLNVRFIVPPILCNGAGSNHTSTMGLGVLVEIMAGSLPLNSSYTME